MREGATDETELGREEIGGRKAAEKPVQGSKKRKQLPASLVSISIGFVSRKRW